MLTYLLLLAVSVTAVALSYARWEYRNRGILTWFGMSLLLAMFLMPNLVIEFATVYAMPRTLPAYVGIVVGTVGALLCVVSITVFASMSKVFSLDAGALTVSGPYSWSRNPQYVGWFLFLLGFTLTDWSLWCLAALIVVALNIHLLVLVEEEHLRRVFGDRYAEYCRKIPRYAGWGRLQI